jgi:hypothetical protein
VTGSCLQAPSQRLIVDQSPVHEVWTREAIRRELDAH